MDSLRNEDSRQRARILICIAYNESTTIGHIIKRAANYTSEVMLMALLIHGRSSVLVLLLLAIKKQLVQFISSHHPLSFFGIPGIAFVIIAVTLLNYGLMVYSACRHSSVEYIVFNSRFWGSRVVLQATGAILYTITALLKGKLKDI